MSLFGIAEAEGVVAQWIETRWRDAMACSVRDRNRFNLEIDRIYADDVVPASLTAKPVGYYTPIIGALGNILCDLASERVFPNPQKYDSFTVAPLEPRQSMEEAVEANRNARVLEIFMRGLLRDGRFYDTAGQQMIRSVVFTGNAVPYWDWDVLVESERAIPRLRLWDIRNVAPSNFYEPDGMNGCEYIAVYVFAKANELRTMEGYRNTKRFTASGEQVIPRIAEDIFEWDDRGGGFYLDGMTGNRRYVPMDKGYKVHRYIGPMPWDDIFEGHEEGGTKWRGALRSMLRKFGPEPEIDPETGEKVWEPVSNYRDLPWWVVDVVDGVLVQCRPHPVFGGKRRPFHHVRYKIKPGETYGRGIYDMNRTMEECFNAFQQKALNIAEFMAKPAVGVDVAGVDKAWLQMKDGKILASLSPGSMVPLMSGAKVSDVFQPLKIVDSADLGAVMNVSGVLRTQIAETTRVTPVLQGMGPTGSGKTATDAIQQQEFSMGEVRTLSEAIDLTISDLLTDLTMILVESVGDDEVMVVQDRKDGERLKGLDAVVHEDKLNELVQGSQSEVVNYVLPIFAGSSRGGFRVYAYGATEGGGKVAKANALRELLQVAVNLENMAPGMLNIPEIVVQMGTALGLSDPAALINTPEQRQEAVQNMAQAQSQLPRIAGAEGGEGGAPSPPAINTGYNPADAIM